MARKISLVLLGFSFIATGCSRPLTAAEKGALIGGAVGVVAGAVNPDAARHPAAPPPTEVDAAAPPQSDAAAPPRVADPAAPHLLEGPASGDHGSDGHHITHHPTTHDPQ